MRNGETMQYICIRKCYFRDQLFEEGQRIDLPDTIVVPAHFKKPDPARSPNLEIKKTSEDIAREEKIKADVVEENKKIASLRAEFESLGKSYSSLWNMKTLEAELVKAKKGI